MSKQGKTKLSFSNRMVQYSVGVVVMLTVIYGFFGWSVLLSFVLASIVGILLLETVNYIEHYGMLRKQDAHGKYERVNHRHSWNSDHLIGRFFLFNLSRHSDHHFHAGRKYQVLRSLEDSPQMPTGYPGMMLLSLVPPLWFWVMNRRLS